MKKLLAVVLFACCAVSGCKKEESSASRKVALLRARSWHVTAHTYTRPGVPPEDKYAQYPSCTTDNTLSFQDGNVVSYGTGPVQCYANEFGPYANSWYLSKEESVLIIDGLGYATGMTAYTGIHDYEIVELSATTLKLKRRWGYNRLATDEYTFSAL